jgi:hypothetical protein
MCSIRVTRPCGPAVTVVVGVVKVVTVTGFPELSACAAAAATAAWPGPLPAGPTPRPIRARFAAWRGVFGSGAGLPVIRNGGRCGNAAAEWPAGKGDAWAGKGKAASAAAVIAASTGIPAKRCIPAPRGAAHAVKEMRAAENKRLTDKSR